MVSGVAETLSYVSTLIFSSVVPVAPQKDVYLLKYADFGVSTVTFYLNLYSISDCGFSNQDPR